MNVSEIEITYNPVIKPSEMMKITCSEDAAKMLRQIWNSSLSHKESFYILLLNRSNKVLGYHQLSVGGTAGTVVDAKIVFQVALKAHCCSLIIAHNHPSGNTQPSEQDIKITQKLKEAGQLLDLNILDHIIMLPEGYVSLADEGYF